MAAGGPLHARLPDAPHPRTLAEVRGSAACPEPEICCSSRNLPWLGRGHRWNRAWIILQIVAICILANVPPSSAFQCRSFDDYRSAEIVPRTDFTLEVGAQAEVFCNYNSSVLQGISVTFRKIANGEREILPFEVVNASRIRVLLGQDEPGEFTLSCFSEDQNTNTSRSLCSKKVRIGYSPLGFENFTCTSPGWMFLNCSWTRPPNPVPTEYTYAYSVPDFQKFGPTKLGRHVDWFVINRTDFGEREDVTIFVVGRNLLGVLNYTYPVNVYSVVVPSTPERFNVTEFGTDYAEVEWEAAYLMDAFPVPFRMELSWRIAPNDTWIKTVFMEESSHVITRHGQAQKYKYEGRLSLPYPHTRYEVMVRMHTGRGSIRENLWSDPTTLTFTTRSKPPEDKVEVSPSCYEANNFLQSREVFVYWRQLDPLLHAGPNFRYQVSATSGSASQPVLHSLLTSNQTYVKFPKMESNVSYSFEITAVNDEGAAGSHSVVVVPPTSQIPATPEMFTVIKYKTSEGLPLYRLMWKPPPLLGEDGSPIVRYTLFWCPRPAFDLRCQEDLEWASTGEDLESLVLSHARVRRESRLVLYERNITGLPQDRQFGIAAVAASGATSGIKWATCSVPYDDSPPAPRPPTVDVINSTSVKLTWSFDCPDKSSVLLSVRISYCEVDDRSFRLDFSDCVSKLTVEKRPLTEHAVIAQLRPFSRVVFSLSLVSVVGTSRNSQPVTIMLPEDEPDGPVRSLNVTFVGNTSLTVQWEAPLHHLTNGLLTKYLVTTQPNSPQNPLSVAATNTQVTVAGLFPYTTYSITVVACTVVGCALAHPSTVSVHTLPGLPAAVNLFSLNSIDGEVSWAFPEESCHSASCSFDLRIPSNHSIVTITGLEVNSVNLRDQNITCGDDSPLNVSIRAVGRDADGRPLPGPWNSKEGPCTIPVPAVTIVPWWIWILVGGCIPVALVCFICAKCGRSAFAEMTRPLKIPDLTGELVKSNCEKMHKPDPMTNGHIPGQALFNPSYESLPNTTCPRVSRSCDEGKRMPLLSQSSINSDADNVEDNGDHLSRHMSGDSSRSSSGGLSEADSALASIVDGQDSTSASSHELAISSLRQSNENWLPVNVRQRSPGPYVLHGHRPMKKVCEGYVAVGSDPSLMGAELDLVQGSPRLITSDPTAPLHVLPTKPPPSATGHSCSPNSDQLRVHPSYSRRSSSSVLFNMKNINSTSPPHSNASSPLPAYSRHSFTPPGSQLKQPLFPPDAPSAELDDLRYAVLAFNDARRINTPESVTDQLTAKRRPSSIPSLFSLEKTEEKNDSSYISRNAPSAYSVVGKRKNAVQPVSSSQGYVTLSSQVPRPKLPSSLGCDQASAISSKNQFQEVPHSEGSSICPVDLSPVLASNLVTSNYCTLEDLESLPGISPRRVTSESGRIPGGDEEYLSHSNAKLDSGQCSIVSGAQDHYVTSGPDRWAFNNPRPRQLDFADEVRYVASAPIENHRGRKCSQRDSDELNLLNGRPSTSDGVSSRPRHLSHSPPSTWVTGAPSLSKQSSGYVSQEALSAEPLVISPKRLFAHSQEGKSSKSIPHEVSFV